MPNSRIFILPIFSIILSATNKKGISERAVIAKTTPTTDGSIPFCLVKTAMKELWKEFKVIPKNIPTVIKEN